jgi:hypothetical protein
MPAGHMAACVNPSVCLPVGFKHEFGGCGNRVNGLGRRARPNCPLNATVYCLATPSDCLPAGTLAGQRATGLAQATTTAERKPIRT